MKTFTNFEDFDQELLATTIPIFLVFTTNWCKPCKKINAILQEIDIEYRDKIRIFKIDAEKTPKITNKYSVKGFPSFLILKEGKVVATKVGGDVSKIKLTAFLDSYL